MNFFKECLITITILVIGICIMPVTQAGYQGTYEQAIGMY